MHFLYTPVVILHVFSAYTKINYETSQNIFKIFQTASGNLHNNNVHNKQRVQCTIGIIFSILKDR